MPRPGGASGKARTSLPELGSRFIGSVTAILRYEALLFLGALALLVFYQLLTGKINTRRLLFAKGRSAASGLSPSRIQLLIVTIGVAIYLLSEVLREPNGDASLSRFQFLIFTFVIAASFFMIVVGVDPPRFPDRIPSEIFVLLGISAGTYAISKGIQSNYEIRMHEIDRQTTGQESMRTEP